MNTFALVVNSGRSGSTFLEYLLKENYGTDAYIAHEDIPVQISRPRMFNRAYQQERIRNVLGDERISPYLEQWRKSFGERSVIETGWTAYHLLPVLYHVFRENFMYVILHRDPVSFALSRAVMGNYHPLTFYDHAHEVSPFDEFSVAPHYGNLWQSMNHFEKCMYWWYVVYREAYEFKERHPEVPCMEIASKDLFSGWGMEWILGFLGLEPAKLKRTDVTKNELPRFCLETFPITDEWKAYTRHPEILDFAEKLGYSFDDDKIARQAGKYRLPKGIGPRIRRATGYWRHKSKLKIMLTGLLGR